MRGELLQRGVAAFGRLRWLLRRSTGRRGLIAALSLALSLFSPGAFPQSSSSCPRVKLTQRPGWVTGGAWLASGRELAVVDSLNETVVLYGRNGRSRGVVTGPGGELVRTLSPQLLQSFDENRLVVQTADDRLVLLDSHFAPRRRAVISRKSAGGGNRMLSSFLWQPVGGNEIVSFSDLELENPRPPRWGTGFVRFSLTDPGSATTLWQGDLQGPERVFNRLGGYQYIAALGDKAYILLMGESTALYESSRGNPGLRKLMRFRSQSTPQLPSFDEWDEYPAVMRAVEESAMPAGLYGWNGYLYMLSRRPLGGGLTQWSLTKLDPRNGRDLGSVVLPTKANHLTVVPGPLEWAIFEKGPVLGRGRQAIETMLLIPARRLEDHRFTGNICN